MTHPTNKKIELTTKELEKEILGKLKAIEEKVLTSKLDEPLENLQVLLMVNDELDDVLLNWQTSQLGVRQFGDDHFDDLDDQDDDF